MKTKSLLFLSILFAIGCGNNQKTSQKLLDSIFINTYEGSVISKGDNFPDFNTRKDHTDLYLVALHERIEPKKFQKKAGWSDEMLMEKTQLLIEKGWLIKDDKELRPTIFIVSDQQGKELYKYCMPLSKEIANSIEKEIPVIKEKFKTSGLSDNYDFDSISFLVLSNVLLDNWQIMEMEAAYLKKENRPERHGKFYYVSLMENANREFETFGIYGNQYRKLNDSTSLSIYGNNRDIVNKRLKNDPAFKDSIMNVALRLTPELNNLFKEIAEDYRPKLVKILNEHTDYSREVFKKTGYSDEITYEEFFIWWYHFIYTDATNILAKRNKLTIPKDGNFYYLNINE